uniref:AT-hook motif nuclear-localized protein n=1 Tax=Oryza meridionalis TaxID=40149 RepID=A0A0E0F9J9_9ORYZ
MRPPGPIRPTGPENRPQPSGGASWLGRVLEGHVKVYNRKRDQDQGRALLWQVAMKQQQRQQATACSSEQQIVPWLKHNKKPPPQQQRRRKGEWYALSAGGSFTPHVIIVATGEDVAARIMSFSQKGPRSVCILAANGTISNVVLNQPGSSGSTFSYEGCFEILQLTGSFTIAEEGVRRRTGGLSVSLAGPDGRVVGGVVAGMLRAASPIQVIVGSFLPNSLKQHQRRMGLHPQPSAALAFPAPMAPPPPPVLTAARPISQAAPGNNGCRSPQVSISPMPPQAHAGVEQSRGAMNLNSSSSSTGFAMVGWPAAASSQSMGHRPSPDINVCLTPQE